MLMFPIETTDHKNDAVIVVLDPGNIDRLSVADPAEVVLRQSGKTLINPTVVICLEKPSKEWQRVLHSGDLKEIIKFLQRGFEYRPDKGDHDNGPQKLSSLN